MNKVEVFSLDKQFTTSERLIKKIAEGILKILGKKGVWVEIYLIDCREMRFLNKKFRGKDKATTILSFEEPRNFIYPPFTRKRKTKPMPRFRKIGEIYLNLNIICKSQIAKRGSISDKRFALGYYLAHGLLHLLGYNHQRKNDRIRMEKLEKFILARL